MQAVGAKTFWLDDPAPVEALSLRRAPLLAAALAFAAGEFLAWQWQFAPVLLAALALLLALAVYALRVSGRIAALPVLAVWAVVGCWCVQMQPWPAPQTQLAQYADGVSRVVRGQVVRVRALAAKAPVAAVNEFEPGAWESEGTLPTESVDLAVEQVEFMTPEIDRMEAVQGGARVTVLDGAPALRCGDVVELPLRMREPERYRDAGAWSYADDLLRQGVAVQANVKAARIVVAGHGGGGLRCRAYAAQGWAATRMQAFVRSAANAAMPRVMRLSAEDAAMLNAMLFGDRAGLRHELRVGFERTGSFHLFVVSGLHVALLAGMLFWVLRRMRCSQGAATVVTIAITAGYAVLTGFGTPVQRALLMTTVFLLARWLGRRMDVLQALGAAAMAVLVWDPRALTEASFQMTFLVLVAVGGVAMPIGERTFLPRLRATRDIDAVWMDARLPPVLAQMRVMLRLFGRALTGYAAPHLRFIGRDGARGKRTPAYKRRKPWHKRVLLRLPASVVRLLLQGAELALVGLVIEACMALPMAVYFHRATPFAIPANLVAVPLVAVLAPLAVATFCASLLGSWVAVVPGAATALVLHGVTAFIHRLSGLQFADARVPGPSVVAVLLALMCLAVACWALRRRNAWLAWVGVAALIAVPLVTLRPQAPVLHAGVLEVTALDVGQGDSLLVVSPDGHTLLVDAGGPVGAAASAENAAASAERWDVGEEVVAPYLWSRRLRTLDAVVLSHAHSDHMGGMPAILRDFHPRELWVSVDPAVSAEFRSLLALAESLHIKVRHFHAGEVFAWGGVTATVLAPEPGYTSLRAPVNDDSLVLRMDYGSAGVLLEGDAERRSEDTMLANGRLGPVTLLKVGHHGSRTSTNPEFLAAVRPQAAVISSGRRNTFGHPRYEVLERLAQAGVKTYRTDREGATTFLLGVDGRVEVEQGSGETEADSLRE